MLIIMLHNMFVNFNFYENKGKFCQNFQVIPLQIREVKLHMTS